METHDIEWSKVSPQKAGKIETEVAVFNSKKLHSIIAYLLQFQVIFFQIFDKSVCVFSALNRNLRENLEMKSVFSKEKTQYWTRA